MEGIKRRPTPREMEGTSGNRETPFKDMFMLYRKQLDEQHDRRERLIKASRDITRESKRAINAVHRISSASRKKDIERISQTMSRIRDVMATRVANEVDENSFYRFHRSFTFGMQEYVEARTFLHYVISQALLSPQEIEKEIADVCKQRGNPPLPLDTADYLLGVADLTGELMRQGVSDSNTSLRVAKILSGIEEGIEELYAKHRLDVKDLSTKIQVLKRSVAKVERACYNTAVQKAECISQQY